MSKKLILQLKTVSIILFVIIITYGCSAKNEEEHKEISLKEESYKTLYQLSEKLLSLQITDESNQNYGAIKCPTCGVLHTRAAESVYPFAIVFEKTGEKKYLNAAINVVNWLIKQQLEEGEWKETPWEWTGTTADQLLMMIQAFPILKSHLSDDELKQWKTSIIRASDFLVKYMSPDFASLNYNPTTAAALAKVNEQFPDERYSKKAKHLARWTIAKMDEDGFLNGESARVFKAKYGIDLGYEIDMSLWGLTMYARSLNDNFVQEKVKKSLKEKLAFFYPNGAIDASWGSRMYKWTTFGSKTADGCQVLFALYADEDARYNSASWRNLQYLRTMINDGLINYGPQHAELMDDVPCIYSTFARAKNLAMAYKLLPAGETKFKPLPADNSNWTKFYPTVNVAIVRTNKMMATVSAYGYKDITNWGEGKYTYRPSGGSIVNLWVEGYGFLQSSSQSKYFRGEVMHMPEIDDTLYSITPRIEFSDSNGYFTNLFECDGLFEVNDKKKGETIISTSGELKNEKYLAGGIAFKWIHKFYDNSVVHIVKLRFHDNHSQVKIIEPFINLEGNSFNVIDDKTVMIEGENRKFEFTLLEGNAKIISGENKDNYWMPFPALKAFPIELLVTPKPEQFFEKIKYKITIKK